MPERYPCYMAFSECPVCPRREYRCQACYELAGNELPRGVKPVVDPAAIENLAPTWPPQTVREAS